MIQVSQDCTHQNTTCNSTFYVGTAIIYGFMHMHAWNVHVIQKNNQVCKEGCVILSAILTPAQPYIMFSPLPFSFGTIVIRPDDG